MKVRRSGFTLVEMMIVIAILSILLAIFLPNLMRARARGLLASCEQNLRNLSTAIETYGTDNKGRYPTVLTILTPDYIKNLPWCPTAKTFYQYAHTTVPDAYTVWCNGTDAHIVINVPVGFPQFDNSSGLIEGRQ